MAQEDCSSVLEHFIHDAANLPLEINHLMEEIQAKDKIIQECRAIVNARDNNLQKFIRLNGSLTPNPKEEQYSKTILQNMDRSQILQDEKIALSEKAATLLDRQIKKLDVRIRDLVNDGVLTNDPPIPSLFDSKERPRDLPKSFFPTETTSTESAASPLNPTAGNNNILNAAQRLANHSARASSASAVTPVAATARNSAPSTPSAATLQLQQRQRESSAGAADNKRRRLNPSLGSLPAASSNLRQSSLGPGTPKVATPGSSRAGSAGPRTTTVTKKASTKKVAPHQQVKKIKASSHMNGKITKRSSSAVRLKPTTGNAAGTNKNSPSAPGEEEEDESILSSVDVSETENAGVRRPGANGEHESDEEMEDDDEEGGEDTKTYCTCQSVSHGDMVACDNDDCPYEWFHWKCVGLTREPLGTWYCDECRKTLGK